MAGMKTLAGLILIVFLTTFQVAIACESDTDCMSGSQCYKPTGRLNGWCVAGLVKDDDNAKASPGNPENNAGTRGKYCEVDGDCDFGERCERLQDRSYGVCMRSGF